MPNEPWIPGVCTFQNSIIKTQSIYIKSLLEQILHINEYKYISLIRIQVENQTTSILLLFYVLMHAYACSSKVTMSYTEVYQTTVNC